MSSAGSVNIDSNDRYRPQFHFTARKGWINDPNGLSYYDGSYHLFYQHNPFGTEWGLMHWGHAVSDDLTVWHELPVALTPDRTYDQRGCYSGTALTVDKQHVLMYTGVGPDGQELCLAWGDGFEYIKDPANPVILAAVLPDSVKSPEFRDPKILFRDGVFYCLASTQLVNGQGALLLFRSMDIRTWEFVSIFDSSWDFRPGVWECPDFFKLENTDVLIVSPQGMTAEKNRFQNYHVTLYKTGTADLGKGTFETAYWDELDYGFDFYAPQTMEDPHGRRILIAWMQMWKRTIPTHDMHYDWAGAMTFPREITLDDGKLIQNPVAEIERFWINEIVLDVSFSGTWSRSDLRGQSVDLEITFSSIEAALFGVRLYCGETEATVFSYQPKSQILTFDRSRSGVPIEGMDPGLSGAGVRNVDVSEEEGRFVMRFLLDRISVETFIQGGQKTMTGTVYPESTSDRIELFAEGGNVHAHVSFHSLNRNK